MAGIGFTLERMTKGRSLSVAVGAYLSAAFLVAGPWIFTVLAIAGASLVACETQCLEVQIFRSVVIYNSVFCLVVTSPIAYVCTRFVSDRIVAKDYESVTFTLIAAIAAFAICALALGGPFYFLATSLSDSEKLASVQNLMLMGASWLLIPFLGAIRNVGATSIAFAVGAAVTVGAVYAVSDRNALWLLAGSNLGLCVIVIMLVVCITREYGAQLVPNVDLLHTALRYWELPLIGVTYAAGLWIDKVIMWFGASAGQLRVAGAFQTMPDYDTPMFWAQLAALPVVAGFFVHIETKYFRLCRSFYKEIQGRASLRQLRLAMSALGRFALSSIAVLFGTLLVIGVLAILLSFVAIDPVGLRPSQMGVLRNAIVAMVFQTSVVFCVILLLYLDLRRPALLVTMAFVILNGALTAALLPLGFTYFGYGNMLASMISFAIAALLLRRELSWIHYHAFVTNNITLRPHPHRQRKTANLPLSSQTAPTK
jgi:uncharacterized membrane protein